MFVSDTPSVTQGVVSKHAPMSVHGLTGAGVVVQHTAAQNPGNSGGPIIDDCGAVLGVATFGYETYSDRILEGLSFGIATETVTLQLATLRSATHQTTGTSSPVFAGLEITAVCNYREGGWVTSASCAVAGAAGLDPDEGWSSWMRGVHDWDNLRYRFDGSGELARADAWDVFGRLADGVHTVEARELRASGWTSWSAPYTFTVRDRVSMLEVRAICNGAGADYGTSADCFAAGSGGILAESFPVVWVVGLDDWDNVRYSIDGGAAVAWEDYTFRKLAAGSHTIRVSEQQAAGWTGWSVPYAFTITGAAPIEIRAICNGAWADYGTSADCFAAGSGGILAGSFPVVWVVGFDDWDNVRYSIDGGAAVAWEDYTFRKLAAGSHTIRVSEQQAAGWTGWSVPYAFSITGAAPIEITAYCDYLGAGRTSAECDGAPVTRGGRQTIWWRGVQDQGNLRVSLDGAAGVAWDDLSLWALSNGQHNIRIGEQQAAGWTGWSTPYWFTIRQ